MGQKLKQSLAGSTYNVIGHVSQVINLEKTDLDRLLNSAIPHSEDMAQSLKQVHIQLIHNIRAVYFDYALLETVGKRLGNGRLFRTLDGRRAQQISDLAQHGTR